MAMRFRILGSGSSGNAALLQTESTRVLIDAGFSGRKLTQMLHEADTRLDQIDAIFITHEHGDHTAGIDTFTQKHPGVTLFANAATRRAVQQKLSQTPSWQVFQTGSRFMFRDLEVDAFAVPHDAQEPVGFKFSTGSEADLFSPRRSLAWLTDLGHIPGHVRERIRDVDLIAIESNHCAQLLQADIRRPWSTKQRISGRHGHLSNEGCREILEEIASPTWRHICLTHLSRDCNSLEAVESAMAGLRTKLTTCAFSIVGPGEGTPTLDLA
ncbi:MAG: MBL fold metallo-hydrolase [Candidatus Synoicihabitans palmerolidicus]|nr:MBL fold metallo-hydrolase [Candidatus Synoicihabitans palmerolidicus]